MIHTIIYDLDDTLYDFHKLNKEADLKVKQEAERRFGIEPEEFGRVFATSYKAIGAYMPDDIHTLHTPEVDLATVHSRTLRLSYTLEQFGIPPLPHTIDLYEIYWGHILDNMQPEENVLEAMTALKQRGVRIGIGSNMTSRIQYKKLIRLGLSSLIDFITVSEESLFDKPDPRFFARVLEKTECPPEECLFVGDNYRYDYLGAKACGMNALWYARREKPWNRLNEEQRREAAASGNILTDHLDILKYL